MTKRNLSKSTLAAAIAGAGLLAAGTASAALSSIADSWHNLGAGNVETGTPNDPAGTANHSNDTAEICVFCHTPHGGDNTAAVPIWNRKLNDPTAYTRYSSLGSSTFDATEAPVGSVTIACLSCHDGGQAIDSLINAPGSGGYNDPSLFAYGSMPRIGTNFVGDDQTNGVLLAGIVQNLGTDLSNDHPVSMQYGGGGITGNAGALVGDTTDPDFTGPGITNPNGSQLMAMAAPATAPFDTLFWIERGADSLIDGVRDREDVILYTRTDLGATEPFVECGSCHDPHNVRNPTFLRVSNLGPGIDPKYPNANGGPSALCLTCHIK